MDLMSRITKGAAGAALCGSTGASMGGAVVGGIKPACYIYCIYDRRSWDGGSCTVYACNTRHIILYRKYGNACIHCLEENRSGNGLLNG